MPPIQWKVWSRGILMGTGVLTLGSQVPSGYPAICGIQREAIEVRLKPNLGLPPFVVKHSR